ncbi:MAG: PmoA family protein [Bryobacteraceae bacterium]
MTRRAFLAKIFEYRVGRTKPYVHPLYFPDGREATLDGPKDHVHHRGLMLGWNDVNGYDFWGEENPGPHGRIVQVRSGVNHWTAADKVLLEERREIRAAPLPEGNWLEWRSELRARAEAVTLSGEKHPYDGLGVRFIREMDGGGCLNSRGTREIDKANGEPAAWCAYYRAGVGGAALFDHPSNPRHPTPFFVMNRFGYLSAAPTFREPLHLKPGEALRFRWGVLVFLSEPESGALGRRWREWSLT